MPIDILRRKRASVIDKPGAYYNPNTIDIRSLIGGEENGPAGVVTNYGIGNYATVLASGNKNNFLNPNLSKLNSPQNPYNNSIRRHDNYQVDLDTRPSRNGVQSMIENYESNRIDSRNIYER